jgi:hypothetical protein
MKTYLSILLLFCTLGLSYGSSHVIVSDSVVKNRVDTIQNFTKKKYRFRGEVLSNTKLDSLLKSAGNQQIEEFITQSNSKNKTGNLLFWVFGLTLLVGVALYLSFLFSLLFSLSTNKPTNALSNLDAKVFFLILADIVFITSGIFGIVSKKKARRLKRKAVELYNEIVKSGK